MTERQALLLETYPDFVADNLRSMRTIRDTLGWSLSNIASRCGTTSQHLSRIERMECLPTKRTYNKLARFFDWEVWE